MIRDENDYMDVNKFIFERSIPLRLNSVKTKIVRSSAFWRFFSTALALVVVVRVNKAALQENIFIELEQLAKTKLPKLPKTSI